jgi:signal transduction histidine kinase
MNSFGNFNPECQANHIIINILEKSKSQADFILENIRGICAVIDEEGAIYKANHELAQLLNVPITNIRQQSLKKLFKNESWNEFANQIKPIKANSQNNHSAFEIHTDALIPAQQKCFLFEIYHYGQYKNLEMNYYFILGTDITTQRSTEDKLKEQIEENKKLVKIITHDLANPLTVIDMLSRNLTRDNMDLKVIQSKLLKSSATMKEILFSVRNLQSIIDGVKKITLTKQSIDKLITETISLFEEKLNEKNISIEFQPSHLNGMVEANIFRNQILANLLSNAIKFTFPNNKITITTEENNDYVIIKIRDVGTGIRTESLSKLFITSQNCSTAGTAGEKGTGYGLPICNSMLKIMGGSISLDSKYIDDYPTEHGTCFSISIRKM